MNIRKNSNDLGTRCLLLDTFVELCLEDNITEVQVYFNDYDDEKSKFLDETDLDNDNGIIYRGKIEDIFSKLPAEDLIIESWEFVNGKLQFNVASLFDRTVNMRLSPFLPYGYSFIK